MSMSLSSLSRECELVCVDPAKVWQLWPRVSGLIHVAMKRGDFSSFADVQDDVLAGRSLLWLAWDGADISAAAITQLVVTEWRKVCVIVACGGAEMARWVNLIDGIEQFAKAEGCKAIRIIGRLGWERVLMKYRVKRIVLEKDI